MDAAKKKKARGKSAVKNTTGVAKRAAKGANRSATGAAKKSSKTRY
jgi:hypothetical protein